MPAASLPPAAAASPAYVEASKPPADDDVETGGKNLPVSSAAPPRAAVPGSPIYPPVGDPFSASPAAPTKRCSLLPPSAVGWLLFAIGWLVSLVWIIGLPVANVSPSSCGARAQTLLRSPNPLAQLVNYEELRELVACRLATNIALVAGGAACLVPWLLGSLVPCCCERKAHCASLKETKSRRSRAAAANTMMSILGVAALIGLIAMCAAELREARAMDSPEQRAQLEQMARVARSGQEAATAVDGILEQVGQALGIAPAPGVGSAASGDGLLGRLFKP